MLAWILHAHATGDVLDTATVMKELLFAGQVTLAAMSTSIVAVLHHHPHIKQKLVDVVQQELSCQELTSDRVNSVEYLEWFVKEMLRMYPPAGGFFRETQETIVVGVSC